MVVFTERLWIKLPRRNPHRSFWLGNHFRCISTAVCDSRLNSVIHRRIFRNDVWLHHNRSNYPDGYWIPASWIVILAQWNSSAWRYGISDSDLDLFTSRHGWSTNLSCRVQPRTSYNQRKISSTKPWRHDLALVYLSRTEHVANTDALGRWNVTVWLTVSCLWNCCHCRILSQEYQSWLLRKCLFWLGCYDFYVSWRNDFYAFLPHAERRMEFSSNQHWITLVCHYCWFFLWNINTNFVDEWDLWSIFWCTSPCFFSNNFFADHYRVHNCRLWTLASVSTDAALCCLLYWCMCRFYHQRY